MHQASEDEHYNDVNVMLYDRFASIIFAYIYRRVACRQDAEDLLLEVFVAASKNDHLEGLVFHQQLAWLQHVARNKVVDAYRSNRRHALLPLEEVEKALNDELTPEEYVLQREKYELLYRSLDYLSPSQQEVVRLHFGNGLPLTEIATTLNKPEGTVRSHLFRALRHLRSIYEQR